MACGACGRRKTTPQHVIDKEAVDFTLLNPKTDTIRGHDRRLHSIRGSLVTQPIGGWTVRVKVGKTAYQVDGPSANRTYQQVSKLYRHNNINLTPDQIWFNLNRVWVKNNRPANAKVTLADLDALL